MFPTIFQATLINKAHPECGVVTIAFPVLNRMMSQSVNLNGQAVARDLIQSGAGVVTP